MISENHYSKCITSNAEDAFLDVYIINFFVLNFFGDLVSLLNIT